MEANYIIRVDAGLAVRFLTFSTEINSTPTINQSDLPHI